MKLTPLFYKKRDVKFENVMIGLYCDKCPAGTFKIALDPLRAICCSCKAVNQIPYLKECLAEEINLKKDEVTDLERKTKEVEEYLKKVNPDRESVDDFRARSDELNAARWAEVSKTAHDGSFK